jgi:hypothetical protein
MRSTLSSLTCAVCVLVCCGAARGAGMYMGYIGPDGGNYNVDAYWEDFNGTLQAVPDDDYAYIWDGQTVIMDTAEPNVRYLWLGYGSTLQVSPGAFLRTTEGLYPSGEYDATVNQSGGEVLTPLLYMGYDPSGGTATYNLSGGTLRAEYSLDPNATGSSSVMLGSEGGTARLIQTGGYLSFIHNSYVHIGNGEGSLGEVTITNGTFAVTRNQFNVGAYKGRGSFTMSGDVTVDIGYKLQVGYRGTGVFNQNGGLVRHGNGEQIYIGLADANGGGLGIYNLTDGTLQLDGKRLYVGRGYYETTGVGVGEFNMSGGLLTGTATGPMEMVVGQKSGRGTFNLSGGSVTTRRIFIASEPVSYDVVPVPEGIVNVTDGQMEATAEIIVGRTGPGQLNISGGSVWSSDVVIVGSDDPNAVGTVRLSGGAMTAGAGLVLGGGTGACGYVHATGGSLTVPGPVLLAVDPSCTGQLTVSKDAHVQLGGLYIYSGEDRSTQVGVEIASAGHSLLHATEVSTLAGTLDVQSLNNFRPHEGDRFVVIHSSDPNGVHFVDNFTEITSNITLGLPGPAAFSGAANGADYELTFLGYTAGDANGDHVVDGGDLSLFGAAWMQSLTGWGNCDFDGDGWVDGSGGVDGGDLALFSSNWMWSLPASPAPLEQPLPEPATMAPLALAAAALRRRR